MSGDRQGDWIQTYTGVQFWPLDPRPEDVTIDDIAHSLANQCRFAGHTKAFYSVAQHSVLVSRTVPQRHALWGLLHDASEAYLVDLPRPLKRFSRIGDEYRLVENRLMQTIAVRFALPCPEPECIRDCDDRVLMTEKRDLMGPHPAKWAENAEPLDEPIVAWDPIVAEGLFLDRFLRISA